MLSSTLEVPIACKCGKWLKQTEEYFYFNRCTDCVVKDYEQAERDCT